MPDSGKKNPKLEIVQNLERRGMSVTKAWGSMWKESLRYFFGDQIREKKVKNWDWVVLNYIWPAAMQEISKLARRVPKILAEPWDSSDGEAAVAWQGILQWIAKNGLSDHGMQTELIKANLDAKLYGYRVYKVYWEDQSFWDDQQNQWVGDVKGKLWSPSHFWANDTESINAGACGTIRYVELEFAKGRWPKFATQFDEEALDHKRLERDGGMGGETIRGQTSAGGTYPAAGLGGVDNADTSMVANHVLNAVEGVKDNHEGVLKYVEIHEAYYKDGEEEHIVEEEVIPAEELIEAGRIVQDEQQFIDTETSLPMEASDWPRRTVADFKRPKYPKGRWVQWVGETIMNADDQVYPYSRWPFIVAPHYLLPHMWQGTDAVQMYKSTQNMINTTVTHLVNNMKMFGDPKIAVEGGAIAAPKGKDSGHYSIGKGAGRIIRLVKGGLKRFKIIDPISPSSAATQLYGLFTQEFKNQVGLQDISQGKASNTTATEATFLVQSANDRILLQSVFEENFIREIMSLSAEIVQQRYDEGRMVRIVGEDQLTGIQQITQGLKSTKFDVHIEVGSTLPFDDERRIAKYEKAYQILQNPVANPLTEDMLQILDIPNRKQLILKYEAFQVYSQFLQIFQAVDEDKMDPVSAMKALTEIAQKALKPKMQELLKEKTIDDRAKGREQEERQSASGTSN